MTCHEVLVLPQSGMQWYFEPVLVIQTMTPLPEPPPTAPTAASAEPLGDAPPDVLEEEPEAEPSPDASAVPPPDEVPPA